MDNPALIIKELNNRSFYHFLTFMWPEVSEEEFKSNWHIVLLCEELQKAAENLGQHNPRLHDLLINIPPGTTKTIIVSIMFPAWCWTKWLWMKFICISYSGALSLESAELSRDLVRSERFKLVYPEVQIKDDKDTKSNFRVVSKKTESPGRAPSVKFGGNRYSTSVGGTLTGFHGHFLIVDDPINPNQAVSETELNNANRWMDNTLPTRKVDKAVSCTIVVMQRLHEKDPSGHLLKKVKRKKIKHICLPGEIFNYQHKVNPPELIEKYVDGLLDPVRMTKEILEDLEADLGQYGYAGQIGQDPSPPKGGMFKIDHFQILEKMPISSNFIQVCRYWDKAGTKERFDQKKQGAYTVGVKMGSLKGGKWIVLDVKRGRWASEERERIIRETAEADGVSTKVYVEQEPGSGGKESAENTIRSLAGYSCYADIPRGDKVYRADPYSVQVNNGNVFLLLAPWNHEYIEEHRFFPFGSYKDQVDGGGGAFSKLTHKKMVKVM